MVWNAKSVELYERAIKVTPGPQSNLGAVWKGGVPLFITKAKGAYVWDVDGNDYIDYLCAFGPGILGHGNEEYIQTLKNQLDTLYYLGVVCQSPLEVELVEKLVQHIPCAESVRFCTSGTEAVQLAIRLARAYTKRHYFIRFEGHYHGWLDNVLGGLAGDYTTGKPFAIDSPEDPVRTEGRDPAAFEQSFKLPWNDIDVLERVLEKYGEEVAMIHMEPILCNGGCCPPRSGYLERVRELCTKYGIVLSFDEIITGFRVSLGGAQAKLGVTPDLATFGKAMAGGIPLAAVAGKKEILDQLLEQKVVGAGTFNSNPLGMAGGLAMIRILEREGSAFYHRLDKLQDRLTRGLKEISHRYAIPLFIQGDTAVFFAYFLDTDKEVIYSMRELKDADTEKLVKFRILLLEEGVLTFRGRWYLSAPLTEVDIDKTLERTDRAMARL